MDIRYNNIGTKFEKFELYLRTEDYIKLFQKDIAFGKLLKIYIGLAKIISADPKKLRSWVDDPMYAEVLDVSKKIYDELAKK